jgi:hypothetical protein
VSVENTSKIRYHGIVGSDDEASPGGKSGEYFEDRNVKDHICEHGDAVFGGKVTEFSLGEDGCNS